MDKPVGLYFRLVPLQAMAELIKYAKSIYIIHLLMYINGTHTTIPFVIFLPLFDLVTRTMPDAYSMMAKKKLQTFILNH